MRRELTLRCHRCPARNRCVDFSRSVCSVKSAVSLNVSLGEFPEAFGTSFALWLQHEVLSLLSVVAPGPRNPCGGRRRDDPLLLQRARGSVATASAGRRRFGSAWP